MSRSGLLPRAVVLVMLCSSVPLQGQNEQKESASVLIREGIALHDRGEYDQAIEKYQKALELEPENPLALYELAFSYSAAGRHKECVAAAEAGLKIESEIQPRLYTVAGNCLDAAGEPKKAAKLYSRGLREHPNDASLAFNFAVTRYGQQKHQDAIDLAQQAIDNAPGHASSHRLLGQLFLEQGLRVPALLATLRFLSLEPSSERSPPAARILVDLLNRGATQESSSEVTVLVDPSSAKGEGDFGGAEMILSLLAALRYTEEGEKLTEMELYVRSVASLAQFFQEAPPVERQRSWAWEEYVHFLTQAYAAELLEPLVYRSLSTLALPGSEEWLARNSTRVAALEEWLAGED